MNNLIAFLKKVKDFRRGQGQRYPLWLILLIIIFGLMTGNLGYRSLGDFAQAHQSTILSYFRIRRGQMPSYSTIRRVMMGVDWSNLIEVFNEWAYQLTLNNEGEEWLALDGKSLKATVQYYSQAQQNFVSLVSVFGSTNGLVLGLGRLENKKKSEIVCVQGIVRDLPFKNKVFTMDALHCQKSTIELISSQGHDYLVAVKKNQPKLYEQLEKVAIAVVPNSQHISLDTSHGRRITREVSVFRATETVQSLWKNSQTFIQVKRSGIRGLNAYEQTAYYLSSRQEHASIFASKIQEHWRIENQLHWVKDVIFNEDKSLISQVKPATNFSILLTVAINLFRVLGFLSITEGQRWLGARLWRLMILLE